MKMNGLTRAACVLLGGVKDETGKEASPLPAGKSSLEIGTENQTKLVGQPVKGPLYDFAPASTCS